jgi:hypothetical protein
VEVCQRQARMERTGPGYSFGDPDDQAPQSAKNEKSCENREDIEKSRFFIARGN